MRWQLALALCAAACGGEDKDKTGGGSDSKGCAATRFAVELSDEKAALMKALFDHVDRDKDAPKIGVYAQIDQWKDAAGTPHTDYRLAGSDRAIIAKYLEARAKADPKLAPAAERAFRYEKTFASGRTYWRTHYVIVPAILDGTAVKAAEAGTDGRVTVQLTPEAVAKLAGTTAANPGKKLAVRAGDTVMAAPAIDATKLDKLVLATAEETPAQNQQVAGQTAKLLSCAP